MPYPRSNWILVPKGGYCYGVECHSANPYVEIHGGFRSQGDALEHAAKLARDFADYTLIQVVKIETPSIGTPIVDRTKVGDDEDE